MELKPSRKIQRVCSQDKYSIYMIFKGICSMVYTNWEEFFYYSLFIRVEAFINKIPDSAKTSICIPRCAKLKLIVHGCVRLHRTEDGARQLLYS